MKLALVTLCFSGISLIIMAFFFHLLLAVPGALVSALIYFPVTQLVRLHDSDTAIRATPDLIEVARLEKSERDEMFKKLIEKMIKRA
ncbi:MAG: hypothetical protein L0Y72_27985 [Gemmataceae bacterium]|nr:hypothetical protein [Gemmataceae bacterium]MCI0742888.1 hypothetical protein [Gemmataceae bacterium]